MGTALDGLNSHQSLTSRRPAAYNLPGFELLHPQIPQAQKFPLASNTNAPQPSRVGNLLTPPSNPASDTGSISPGTSNNSLSSGQALPSYSQGYWPTTNSYSFGSGRNNSNSPTVADGLPPTPYELNHRPHYQSPITGSSSSAGASPTTQQPQQTMAHVLMNAQATAATVPPTPPQQSNVDAYGQKLPGTPLYSGSQQTTPHQASFQPYQTGSSAMHHQPGVNGPSSRISPIQVQLPSEGSQLGQYSRPYPSYSLPAMSGPIMTNVHNPNNQMALMGSMQPSLLPAFNSGHAASMHGIYGQPHHMHGHLHQPPPTDRPYRCDTCSQSFNRNHDLKRHKRIHLAVKPFPCSNCDKSFSRKDALKRHVLVKGCGKDKDDKHNGLETNVATTSNSAHATCSDDANDNPAMRVRSRNEGVPGHQTLMHT
ncbi:hypothetical protein FQN55_005731 [Onygenales sp. PD_40]|nr:hypothetical protein FQN55_005731 [Onygenales sp. PD_40]KAK2791558.1 hypothetical protein FQN52_004747 [Onygenales sp. PD_12]